MNYDYSSSERDFRGNEFEEKSNRFNGSVFSQNRYYINSKFFLEVDVDVDLYADKRKEDAQKKSKEKYRRVDVKLPLSIGFGRIEQVQDARLALYILEEMDKSGRLKKEPSHEEILQLARELSAIQNKRMFDFREKLTYELVAADSVLQEMGLVEDSDAIYFGGLYDNLQYGDLQIRSAGSRWSIGVSPFLKNSDSEDEENDIVTLKIDSKSEEVYGNLKYLREKPFKLNWQSSLYATIEYGYENRENEFGQQGEDTEELDVTGIKASLNYYICYYPNTRTSASIGFGGDYLRYDGEEKTRPIFDLGENYLRDRDIEHKQWQGRFNAGFNYYISRQLQLRAHYSLTYYNFDSDSHYLMGSIDTDQDSWNHHFNVSLIYKLF
jgi:hypothetical protein